MTIPMFLYGLACVFVGLGVSLFLELPARMYVWLFTFAVEILHENERLRNRIEK